MAFTADTSSVRFVPLMVVSSGNQSHTLGVLGFNNHSVPKLCRLKVVPRRQEKHAVEKSQVFDATQNSVFRPCFGLVELSNV